MDYTTLIKFEEHLGEDNVLAIKDIIEKISAGKQPPNSNGRHSSGTTVFESNITYPTGTKLMETLLLTYFNLAVIYDIGYKYLKNKEDETTTTKQLEECKGIKSSNKRFPDGAHYRIEMSGTETAGILEAVIDEAKKQGNRLGFKGFSIHRAIATVRGSAHYSDEQLEKLAKTAAENKIEVIICPGSLAQAVFDDPNRILSGLNFRNSQEVEAYFDEISRCIKIGFRGFLVWSRPILEELNFRRAIGEIPAETIFKLSTFANSFNVYDFKSAERAGANTINTANGLTLEELSGIRQSGVRVTLDNHMTFWKTYFKKNEAGLVLASDPYDRIKDAPELARICAPCYFKFEADSPRRRGISVYDLSKPDWTEGDLAEHKRNDVRTAAEVVKHIKEQCPELVLSDWGPDDLRVPSRFGKLVSDFQEMKKKQGRGKKATA